MSDVHTGCCHSHEGEPKATPAWVQRDRLKTLAAYVPLDVAMAARDLAAARGVPLNQILREVLVEAFRPERRAS